MINFLLDFLQFIIAMIGSIALMYFSIIDIGSISILKEQLIKEYGSNHFYLDFMPFFNSEIAFLTICVWLGFQWWSSWYPGAEPGGGGYVIQRVLSTKSEKDAIKSTLLFNILHYAVRPWPWIIVALVALLVYLELKPFNRG